MMTGRRRSQGFWGFWWRLGLPTVLVVAGGMAAGAMVVSRFSGFDLRQVPLSAPAYQPAPIPAAQWRRYESRGLSVRVPATFVRRQGVSNAPGAVILTDRRHTLWLSITVRRLTSRWTPWWYRMCLYARRNPIGLIGKASVVPPLGTRTPRLIDQRLGPWQGYLYVDRAPHRLIADLFDETHHVTVVLATQRGMVLDLEMARAIMASVRITTVKGR